MLKKIFWICAGVIIFVTLMGFVKSACAADVTLAWDRSVSTTVTGYTVHYGPVSGLTTGFEYMVDAKDVDTFTVKGLPPGTCYFAVKAYDGVGNEIGSASFRERM